MNRIKNWLNERKLKKERGRYWDDVPILWKYPKFLEYINKMAKKLYPDDEIKQELLLTQLKIEYNSLHSTRRFEL
jgi:hypothetical protein